MNSFFGSGQFKEAVRARVQRHHDTDTVRQGVYFREDDLGPSGGRGCFIGCALHSGKHADFASLLGMSSWFARMGEAFFEHSDAEVARGMPLPVYDAIKPGVDLTPIGEQYFGESFGRMRSGMVEYSQVPELMLPQVRWHATPHGERLQKLINAICNLEPEPGFKDELPMDDAYFRSYYGTVIKELETGRVSSASATVASAQRTVAENAVDVNFQPNSPMFTPANVQRVIEAQFQRSLQEAQERIRSSSPISPYRQRRP